MKRLIYTLLSFALLTGCAQKTIVAPEDRPSTKESVDTTLSADDVAGITWKTDDEVSVFSSAKVSENNLFRVTSKENATAMFTGQCVAGATTCAVYPYQSGGTLAVDGTQFVISATVPSVQSDAVPSDIYVAVSSGTELDFHPVCAQVKMPLISEGEIENIVSITLTGNNNENLSGPVQILAYSGSEPVMLQSGIKDGQTVTVEGAWQVGEDPTYVEVKTSPLVLRNGFNISVKKADETVMTKSFDSEITVSGGETILPAFIFEGPKYYVKYAAPAKVAVTGYKTDFDESTKTGRIWFYSADVPDVLLLEEGTITSITIPAFIENIGYQSFRKMTALSSVIFEAGAKVKTFGDQAFQNCTALKGTFTVPASVVSLGKGLFNGSVGITSVVFEDGSKLETIFDNAFAGLTAMKTITLPASVKSIGTSFNTKFTTKFKAYILAAVPPKIPATNVFNVKFLDSIYVPAGSVDAYKTAWATYKSYIKAMP